VRRYPETEPSVAWLEAKVATSLACEKRHGAAMASRMKSIVLWAAMIASAACAAADRRGSLADLKVAGAQRLAPTQYADASAVAARGGTSLDIALAVAGRFEGATQHIIQVNEGVEAPTASGITVLRDGLLDDSVRSERWEIAVDRAAGGAWSIREVHKTWRCRRGGQTDAFAATRCP
jgi:hypothetical protein